MTFRNPVAVSLQVAFHASVYFFFAQLSLFRRVVLSHFCNRWLAQIRLVLALFVFFALGVDAWCAPQDLVILSPLHSGAVYVFDLAKQTRVATLPVEDGAGVVGVAFSPDHDSLYVVDGNVRSRLRRFDTRSWQQQLEQEFSNRVLALGAEQVIHLTADNRWLLIKTYDVGAASFGVRVFDVKKSKFTPAGLPIKRCASPRFASAPDGTVAAVCAGWVEFFRSDRGGISTVGEIQIPSKDAAGVSVTPNGDVVFILGGRVRTMPQLLVQISLQPAPRAKSWKLPALLGASANMAANSYASMLEIDQKGNNLLVVHGARAWLLAANPIGLRRALRLPGPVDGAQLSRSGRVLYTLRRDPAKKAMLLGRTDLETGTTTEVVLLEELPLAPVVWRFALSSKDSQ